MKIWRLTTKRHAASAFDGEGARRHGGRFNDAGSAVVYCAATLSLAALEVLVHIDPTHAPAAWVAIPATIPDDLTIRDLKPEELPSNWRSYPAPEGIRTFCTSWLQARKSAVLSVPSAIVPDERNYLLDPSHPDMGRIEIGEPLPFTFDPRLVP